MYAFPGTIQNIHVPSYHGFKLIRQITPVTAVTWTRWGCLLSLCKGLYQTATKIQDSINCYLLQ